MPGDIPHPGAGGLSWLAATVAKLELLGGGGDGFNFLHIDLCFECALNSED
jgi:hypothetical protein